MILVFVTHLALAQPHAGSLSLGATQWGCESKGDEKGAGYNVRNKKSRALH